MLTLRDKPEKPYIVLSHSLLVTTNSSYQVIFKYIYERYIEAIMNFGINDTKDHILIIKYQKIVIDIDQLNKKFGNN
jgi:hypothetical protein